MPERRLAAILAADIVGYSALMAEDEAGALEALRRFRREVLHPAVAGHRGQVVKNMGDGWLVEFASAVDAVNCAILFQTELPADQMIRVRVGIHVGDVTHEDDDIFGDGVNVAARLEALADPGAIVISDAVHVMLDTTLTLGFDDQGERRLKNIPRPQRVWARKAQSRLTAPAAEMAKTDNRQVNRCMIVQPFSTGDGRSEVHDLAAALTSELAQYLSGNRWLAVRIAEQSQEDAYVLSGRIRASGDRVRLEVNLAGLDGTTLWAEKYDGSLDDVFDWQDATGAAVAARCVALASINEARWLDAIPEEQRTAGMWIRRVLIGTFTEHETAAMRLAACQRAMELDPEWSRPYVLALVILASAKMVGISSFPEVSEANQNAWFSKIDSLPKPLEPSVRAGLAFARHRSKPDLAAFKREIDQILREATNNFNALVVSTMIYSREGDPQRAIDAGNRALGIFGETLEGANIAAGISLAQLRLGRDVQALENARKALDIYPLHPYAMHCAAAALQLTGRDDEAREMVSGLIELAPSASIARIAGNASGEGLDRVLEALRIAGLPEGNK